MKLRPLLILLLFVVSAGVLAWIYYAATREPAAKHSSPWTGTIADLDDCCRRKHVASIQYDHFADIAQQENEAAAARLFRAMAFSSRLHENNCATAIVRLGGEYTPPAKVVVFQGTTPGNIDRSLAYAHTNREKRKGSDIDRAMGSGNRYAARVLIWASAGDLRHIVLMQRHRSTHATGTGTTSEPDARSEPGFSGHRTGSDYLLTSRTPQPRNAASSASAAATGCRCYLVCPTCGNIYGSPAVDPYCPFCLTDSRKFLRFE